MKRVTVSIILVAALFLSFSSASAFDGLRKGFVLGGGLGVAAVAKWSVDFQGSFLGYDFSIKTDESRTGLGTDFIIGYAWDEANMIVYHASGAFYKTKFFGDYNAFQAFNGAAWHHYFGEVGKAFYTVAGAGLYGWKVENYEANDPGVGYLVGAGYEFTRHVQAGVYLSGGKTSDVGVDFGHMHVNVMVTAVAF